MISVLIPSYQCGPWLRESIDSMLAQSHADREIVVVDDGSTDDTAAILRSYGERVRVVQGAHAGLSAARNLCLAHARGDLIAFHDADDVAQPDRLASQAAWLASHPGWDGVFGDGARMDTGERVVPRAVAARCDGRQLTAADVFDGFPVFFQAALVRRVTFAAVGPFDPALQVHTDMGYGYRLVARARIGYQDRLVFRYRWHESNMTRDRLRGREDIARALEHVFRTDPLAVRAIGEKRLRHRLARHHYRLARMRRRRGDLAAAREHCTRALTFQPLLLRARVLRHAVGG